MTTYLDAKENVIEQIKKYFENVKIEIGVFSCTGLLDENEIKNFSLINPSIYVALKSIEDSARSDESVVSFVCYICLSSNQKVLLYDNAILLTGSLIAAIKNLEFGNYGYEACDIKAECLHYSSTDEINTCLWAVNFKAKLRSVSTDGSILDELDLENFEGYDATHNTGDKKTSDEITF